MTTMSAAAVADDEGTVTSGETGAHTTRNRHHRPASRPIGSTPATVAFVFAGGASGAAYQVGALQALLEAGVTADLVVGTSAGALNAAAYAADPSTAIERLVPAWTTVHRRDLFPLRPRTFVEGVTGHHTYLFPSFGLRGWIAAHLTIADLAGGAVPLHVVATDVESGAPVTLSSGPALPALLASAALPGIFPPVEIGGRLLIDGGVAADTPVHQAEALGATDVIVLGAFSPGGAGPRARSATALGWYAYEQIFAHWSSDLTARPGHRISVVPLPPRDGRGPLDFSSAASRISQSYALTRSWLRDGAGMPARSAAPLTLVR